jgi:hypothetical protein
MAISPPGETMRALTGASLLAELLASTSSQTSVEVVEFVHLQLSKLT